MQRLLDVAEHDRGGTRSPTACAARMTASHSALFSLSGQMIARTFIIEDLAAGPQQGGEAGGAQLTEEALQGQPEGVRAWVISGGRNACTWMSGAARSPRRRCTR